MSGQIDIGWGATVGLKELAEGKIHIIANGNMPSLRTRPCASTWSMPACWRSAGTR
jgi:hypothetical protein